MHFTTPFPLFFLAISRITVMVIKCLVTRNLFLYFYHNSTALSSLSHSTLAARLIHTHVTRIIKRKIICDLLRQAKMPNFSIVENVENFHVDAYQSLYKYIYLRIKSCCSISTSVDNDLRKPYRRIALYFMLPFMFIFIDLQIRFFISRWFYACYFKHSEFILLE